MSKLLNLILILAIAGVFLVAVGGGIAGQAAKKFAEGGGQVEARAFTSETYSHAEAGNNGVAVAITGDHNGVNVAYSQVQPTPQSAAPDNTKPADGMLGVLRTGVAAVVAVLLIMVWMMASSGGKYE